MLNLPAMATEENPLRKQTTIWALINAFIMGYAICDYVHTQQFSMFYVVAMVSIVAQLIYRMKK